MFILVEILNILQIMFNMLNVLKVMILKVMILARSYTNIPHEGLKINIYKESGE